MGNEQSSPSRGGASTRRRATAAAGGSPSGNSDGTPLSPDNSDLNPSSTTDSRTLDSNGNPVSPAGTSAAGNSKASLDFADMKFDAETAAKLASEGATFAAEVGRVGYEKTRALAGNIQSAAAGDDGGRKSSKRGGRSAVGGLDDVLDSMGGLCTTFSTMVNTEDGPTHSRRGGSRRRYDSDDDETRYSDEDSRATRDTFGTYGDSTYATEDNRRGGYKIGRGSRQRSGISEMSYDDGTAYDDTTYDSRGAGKDGRRSKYKGNSFDEDETTNYTYDDRSDVGSSIVSGGAPGASAPASAAIAASSGKGKEILPNGPTTPVAEDAGVPTSGIKSPLASSFAKRCYFTKSGIGKTTQHYEGLTLTGNVVLMLASAMKLKGCPTICDEDLRRVEQTYPNQFSRLPDELLLSSGWRRISKYCHFSNRPIPDGIPFFHSKHRCHPQTGGYYFLLAAAVGMVRPIDVEPLTHDTLVVLQTDYPTQCDIALGAGGAAARLIEDPSKWTLVNKFCFFSGGPINTEEDVYYVATLEGNEIHMLAFLSPSLTPEELYRLGRRIVGADGSIRYERPDKAAKGNADVSNAAPATADEPQELTSVRAVEQVESVYDLTERDFADLRLYHLGPCRALPAHLLKPEAWTKVVPPHFVAAKEEALRRAREHEKRHGQPSASIVAPESKEQPKPSQATPQTHTPAAVLDQTAAVAPEVNASRSQPAELAAPPAVPVPPAPAHVSTTSVEQGGAIAASADSNMDNESVGANTAAMAKMEGGMLTPQAVQPTSPGLPSWGELQQQQQETHVQQQQQQQPVFPHESFPDPFANQSAPAPQQQQQQQPPLHAVPLPAHGYINQPQQATLGLRQHPSPQPPVHQAYPGHYQYPNADKQMQQTFGTPFYTAQALSHTASQGQLVGYGGTPLSPDQLQPPQVEHAEPGHSVFPNDERAQQLRREVEEEGAFGAVGPVAGDMPLDEALGMSRGDAPSIPARTKAEGKDVTHGDFIDDQAASGANISTYDDPPLDQLDEAEDGSISVEENPWRGEDPPEEVPHDEYVGSEYDDDMPDDEMASRTGDGTQETISEDPIQEAPSEDPTHASESVDRYGALEHQGDASTIGTGEGDGEEETQVTQESRVSRGSRGSLAASLKERYRGKRSPGIRIPPTPSDAKSGTSIGTSSANSLVNGISVDTPRFSDEEGYSGVDSPGFSDNVSNGEFQRTDDGYYYEGNDRRREEETTPYSKEDNDGFASPRSKSQFSPQSDFTDSDEFVSPLGSPTGQARGQTLQQDGNDDSTSPSFEFGEQSPQASQRSPSVALSPSDAGSYTDGSYTTEASSMISAEANPSTRRALILQMAKARMNSGKRREEEEEENSADIDSKDEDSELKGENGEEKTGSGQDTSGDAVEVARARSPGGSVDDFEGVTADLD